MREKVRAERSTAMNLIVLLIIVLVVISLAGSPTWGYHSFGWYPSGAGGIIILILLILLLTGRL